MLNNLDWQKPETKPYHHQVSPDGIKKLVDCVELFNKGEIDTDTTFKMQKQTLTDKIDDPEFFEFTIENFVE
jgi:hypothetical protein